MTNRNEIIEECASAVAAMLVADGFTSYGKAIGVCLRALTAPDASAPTVPEGMRERVLCAIPGSWLDPLLTGPEAVIPKGFRHAQVIEALLNAVRARVEAALAAAPAQKGGEG